MIGILGVIKKGTENHVSKSLWKPRQLDYLRGNEHEADKMTLWQDGTTFNNNNNSTRRTRGDTVNTI